MFAKPEFAKWVMDRIPLGRLGQLDEVAASVVYVASDAAALMTGTSLVIDGGWTAQQIRKYMFLNNFLPNEKQIQNLATEITEKSMRHTEEPSVNLCFSSVSSVAVVDLDSQIH